MTYSRSPRIALVVAAVLAAVPAQARDNDCRPTISTLNGATIASYDALANSDFVAPMQIVVRNNGTDPCTGVVNFNARRSDDKLKGPRAFAFDYLIVGESNANDIIYDPMADRGRAIPVNIPAGGSVTLRPQLRVNGGQTGQSGRYEAVIEAKFREIRDREVGAIETTVALAASVVPSVQANFAGLDGGSPTLATLALGELSTGLERSIGLQLRSNTDVDVTVTSMNRGTLVRKGGGGEIPYDITIGNRAINLRQIDEIKLQLGDDSTRLKTRQINVKIGDTARSRAGTYDDTITFRVSAR